MTEQWNIVRASRVVVGQTICNLSDLSGTVTRVDQHADGRVTIAIWAGCDTYAADDGVWLRVSA